MPAVSPCSQGHLWQPLLNGLSLESQQSYCSVCGLIETVSQHAETIVASQEKRTAALPGMGGQAATLPPGPDLAVDLSAQAETITPGAPAAGRDDSTAETVPPAVPPT